MKSPIQIIKRMVKDYPNDMELGARIRWYIAWLDGNLKENPKNNPSLHIAQSMVVTSRIVL